MFNSNKRNDNTYTPTKKTSDSMERRENTETSVGSECIIKGKIENPSSLQFHGYLEGSINCGDYLVICKEAIIEGDIEADTAVLYGNLTGSIRADKVELKSCAQIYGDIETYIFDMENGAFFNGNIKMLKSEERISKSGPVATRENLHKVKDKELPTKGSSKSFLGSATGGSSSTGKLDSSDSSLFSHKK
ncbi:MAG: polymer-forming cytoskeletal protein [Neisseriaceae bacterium]